VNRVSHSVTDIPRRKNRNLRLQKYIKNKDMMTKAPEESTIMIIEMILYNLSLL